MPRIIFALLLIILPARAAMAVHVYFLDPSPGETVTALSSAEARVLLKYAGFPELADSWIVDGYQGWYKTKQCVIEQELAAYSTPKETSPGVYRSNLVVLTASKLIITQPDCEEKLPAPQRRDLKAAAFGDRDNSGDKPPADTSDLFAVGDKTTDAQLALSQKGVLLSQKCFKSPTHCPVTLKYYDNDGWIHQHLSLFRLDKIINVGGIYGIGEPHDHLNIIFDAGNKNLLLMSVYTTDGRIHEIGLYYLVHQSHGP